ncbi:hypothetical protein ACQP2F_15365 [Actinoplanes sp. CA-030573]|uniref:hypothetical protein n=1 Tax=Actinoplanes sp. CA-030573 TaxID=3239898 RepID=UPI003D8B841F
MGVNNTSRQAQPGRHRRLARRPNRARLIMLVGLLAVGGLRLWEPARAAFTASTQNMSNGWSSGTVTLSGDTTSSVFQLVGLTPRSAAQASCIRITYTGSLGARVRLFAAASGVLAEYVQFSVDEGDAGGDGDCTGFSASGATFTGTLASFAATFDTAANGFGNFTPPASGANRFKVYRIATSVRPGTPEYLQDQSASATFTWQAQSP